MVTNRIGPPVQGSDFFDRDGERRRAWDYLHRDHLLLLAPRRVGKTSLMLRLKDEAVAKGFAVAYADVAKAPDEVAFVRELLKAVGDATGGDNVFRQLARGPLGKQVRRIRKIGLLELDTLSEETWTEVGESLTGVLDRQDGRWLLMGASRPTLLQLLAHQIRDADQRAEKLRYLLDVLEGDGYLVADAGRYRFQSPLLRAYWRRRVVP